MGDQVLTEQLVSQVVMDHLEYQAGQAFQVLVGDQGTLVLLVQVVYLADQGEEVIIVFFYYLKYSTI